MAWEPKIWESIIYDRYWNLCMECGMGAYEYSIKEQTMKYTTEKHIQPMREVCPTREGASSEE